MNKFRNILYKAFITTVIYNVDPFDRATLDNPSCSYVNLSQTKNETELYSHNLKYAA